MTGPVNGGELYVYYRVPVDARVPAAAEIDALHRRLVGQWPGLLARRLSRDAPGAPDETWMEVFQRPGGLDPDALDAIRAAAAAWPSARVGPRHEEHFTPQAEHR